MKMTLFALLTLALASTALGGPNKFTSTGALVPEPSSSAGSLPGTLHADGTVGHYNYNIMCNDTGCSNAGGILFVAKLADGRLFHTVPVDPTRNPLADIILHGKPFTYYEKPLKGYGKNKTQFCVPNGSGEACYVEAQ